MIDRRKLSIAEMILIIRPTKVSRDQSCHTTPYKSFDSKKKKKDNGSPRLFFLWRGPGARAAGNFMSHLKSKQPRCTLDGQCRTQSRRKGTTVKAKVEGEMLLVSKGRAVTMFADSDGGSKVKSW